MDHPEQPALPEIDCLKRQRDPGSTFSRRLAIIGGLLVFAVVVTLQHMLPAATANATPAPGDQAASIESDMVFRLSIRLQGMFEENQGADLLKNYAHNDLERLYFAVAEGELDGPQAALDHMPTPASAGKAPPGEASTLPEQTPQVDAEPNVRKFWADVDAFRRIYEFARDGGRGDPVTAGIIDEAQARQLVEDHDFYGRVGLTYPLAKNAPERLALRKPGLSFLGLVALGTLIALAVLTGCILFIVAIVQLAAGRITPRFEPPAPGGSVFMEVFGLFVLGFLCLKYLVGLVSSSAAPDATWPTFLALGLQWLLLAVPFWPLLRSMNRQRFAGAIGLHRGRGLFREMGAGIACYLAGLPLFIAALVLVFILIALKQVFTNQQPQPPSNPMIELVGKSSPLMLMLFFLLATLWAPLCEELIFRGALYRHVRGYLPSVFAALLTGCMFALMHNYPLVLTPPLIVLGFNFALMREWRGSLIPSMTAHAMHNGTLLLTVFLLLKITSS